MKLISNLFFILVILTISFQGIVSEDENKENLIETSSAKPIDNTEKVNTESAEGEEINGDDDDVNAKHLRGAVFGGSFNYDGQGNSELRDMVIDLINRVENIIEAGNGQQGRVWSSQGGQFEFENRFPGNQNNQGNNRRGYPGGFYEMFQSGQSGQRQFPGGPANNQRGYPGRFQGMNQGGRGEFFGNNGGLPENNQNWQGGFMGNEGGSGEFSRNNERGFPGNNQGQQGGFLGNNGFPSRFPGNSQWGNNPGNNQRNNQNGNLGGQLNGNRDFPTNGFVNQGRLPGNDNSFGQGSTNGQQNPDLNNQGRGFTGNGRY